MDTGEDDELTPEEIASIERSILDGVTYSINWRDVDGHEVTAIHWHRTMLDRPATPIPLVESILEHVTSEGMPLFLDGQEYHVKKISTDG